MATTLFAGGSMMSVAVVESLGGVQPAMDDLAWDPNGLPLISTWLWPVALGVGLCGGVLIVVLVARSVVLPRLRAWVDVGAVRWPVAGLPVAMGAVMWLTFPLPTMLGSQGVMIASSLMVVLCGAAWTMGHGFEQVEKGRGVVGLVVPVAVGALAVVLLLLTNSPAWVLVSGLLLVPGFMVGSEEQESTDTDEEGVSVGVLGMSSGSLAVPTLSVVQMDVALQSSRDLGDHSTHGALVLMGEEGAGKTRWLHALTDRWTAHNSSPVFLAEARPSSASASESEPYDVLAQLLRGALPVLRRLEVIERAAETDASFAETGDALLEGLPGVGLILGLLPEAVAESGSERLKADALAAVQGILADRDLVWSIDDVQAIDVESWEAIEHILDAISSAEESVGRMCLLLSCSTGDYSRIEGLSRWLETTQIPIPALDDPALTELIHCSGLQSPNPKQAAWLRGFGETAGSVLSVVRHLEATQQLVGQDPQALPGMAALERLQEPVPTDLLDRELSRLSVIGEEHLLILEMAAQCGLQFEASDVASGLGSTRMQVLSALRKVEVEYGLIEDRNEDDWFSFLMRMTHQALLYRTRTRRPQAGGQHGIPELARAFHSRVADALIERWQSFPNSISGERIYRHIASSGPARASELSRWALVAGEQAGLVHAWDRAAHWVARVGETRGKLSEEQSDRLIYLDAGCRMASGTQDARDEARDMFRGLIESTHVDSRMALLRWLEVSYEEPEKDGLEKLQVELKAVSGQTWPKEAMHESVVFYETLVAHRLETLTGGPLAVVAKLEALGQAVDALRADGAVSKNRFVDLLLARIMNELALKLFQLKGDEVPADRKDRFHAAAQRSLGLKQLHGDLPGQAATHGLMGDYLHFVEGDLQGARSHYDTDLEILENMGDRNKQPGLLNKIGLVVYKSSSEPSRVEPALHYAQRSMTLATHLGREIDMLFAAQQLMELSVSHGLPMATWDQALRDMKSMNVHAAITSDYLKMKFAENLQSLRDSIEGDPPESIKGLQVEFRQEKTETS